MSYTLHEILIDLTEIVYLKDSCIYVKKAT